MIAFKRSDLEELLSYLSKCRRFVAEGEPCTGKAGACVAIPCPRQKMALDMLAEAQMVVVRGLASSPAPRLLERDEGLHTSTYYRLSGGTVAIPASSPDSGPSSEPQAVPSETDSIHTTSKRKPKGTRRSILGKIAHSFMPRGKQTPVPASPCVTAPIPFFSPRGPTWEDPSEETVMFRAHIRRFLREQKRVERARMLWHRPGDPSSTPATQDAEPDLLDEVKATARRMSKGKSNPTRASRRALEPWIAQRFLPTFKSTAPLTPALRSRETKARVRLPSELGLPASANRIDVKFHGDETAASVLGRLAERYRMSLPSGSASDASERTGCRWAESGRYVLRVRDRDDFLVGRQHMGDSAAVRRALRHGEDIELTMVDVASIKRRRISSVSAARGAGRVSTSNVAPRVGGDASIREARRRGSSEPQSAPPAPAQSVVSSEDSSSDPAPNPPKPEAEKLNSWRRFLSGDCLGSGDVPGLFRLRVVGADGLRKAYASEPRINLLPQSVCVATAVTVGEQVRPGTVWLSPWTRFSDSPRWAAELSSSPHSVSELQFRYRDIPLGARLAIFIIARRSSKEEVIASSFLPLVSVHGTLVSGARSVGLWCNAGLSTDASETQLDFSYLATWLLSRGKGARGAASSSTSHVDRAGSSSSISVSRSDRVLAVAETPRAAAWAQRRLPDTMVHLARYPSRHPSRKLGPTLLIEFPSFILPVVLAQPVFTIKNKNSAGDDKKSAGGSGAPPRRTSRHSRETGIMMGISELATRGGSAGELDVGTHRGRVGVPSTPRDPRESRDSTPSDAEVAEGMRSLYVSTGDGRVPRFELLIHDPMERLKPAEHSLVWSMREMLTGEPDALPRILGLADWTDLTQAIEACKCMLKFRPPTHPYGILSLLSFRFQHPAVRRHAVDLLTALPDHTIAEMLPQLVQSLKAEAHDDSRLARFLLSRGVTRPHQIGQYLAWHLRASTKDPQGHRRYGLMLEALMQGSSLLRVDLNAAQVVIGSIGRIALAVAKRRRQGSSSDAMLNEWVRESLLKVNQHISALKDKSFPLPYDPSYRVASFDVKKCRILTSKKVPLWLEFRPAGSTESAVRCIFKAGDDLRQDMLIVQAIRFMDAAWLRDGLDMRLRTYQCIATAGVREHGGMGLIQVIDDAYTKGTIQRKYGGRVGAFRANVIRKFLEEKNPGDKLPRALRNFLCSCAGYCVASYVLGLGDRHSDNVMIRSDGSLFHIDFGHILGAKKSKFGIKREREEFLLTPAMAYAIGGKGWKASAQFEEFKALCVRAYLAIRRRAAPFLRMFEAMVPAGMPQLNSLSDLDYVRERLALPLTAQEAEKSFRAQIQRSLGTTWRLFDDFIHDNVHFGK